MNIKLLQGKLAISENPGIKSTDPRFDKIVSLVEQGKYIEAAESCEIVIKDEIYDIRLICYFLYGYWLKQGLISLGEVINSLDYIVLNNWEAVGPAKRRKQNFQNSLGWIFRQLLKKIQYEETKNTELWQKWQASVSTEELNKMLQASEAFRLSTSKQLEEDTESVVVSSKIDNWLRSLQRLVSARRESEQVETEKNELNATEINTAIPKLTFKVAGSNIEVSYHMELLLNKLAAFEYLLEEEKFSRAALLADDINQTLADFDPMIYFPKTFEPFIRLKALNFEELSTYEDHRESSQWEVMQDWLKTDLDSFTNN
ncbi:MAG: hypothetical protein GQ569_04305 [Methylococcaceae bacterium]|nr:hypothetical protein [Methylococcaceae bacterium]